MPRRTTWPLAILPLLLLLLLPAGDALAGYPRRPVTLVTPYGASGSSDLAARSLAVSLPEYLGQPVIVVNRAGANGVVGTTFVSRSRADGYTLLMGRVGANCLVPALNESIAYHWDSFSFIGLVEMNPFVYVVRADSPHKTLADLLAAIEAAPGTISYSDSGPQTLLALGTLMLLDQAGLAPDAAVGIPYEGGGTAATALLGGHVDFLGVNIGPVLEQIKAGKLRALAVTTPERLESIPDVPTVRECGYPALESVIGWSALLGPKDLPREIIATWAATMARIAADPQWAERTRMAGSIPFVKSPEETREFIRGQYEMYRTLGEKRGLIIH